MDNMYNRRITLAFNNSSVDNHMDHKNDKDKKDKHGDPKQDRISIQFLNEEKCLTLYKLKDRSKCKKRSILFKFKIKVVYLQ